jgi:hypothetical protein
VAGSGGTVIEHSAHLVSTWSLKKNGENFSKISSLAIFLVQHKDISLFLKFKWKEIKGYNMSS